MMTGCFFISTKPVSQIWALMRFPSVSMLFVANSTPMVDLESKLNSSLVNRDRRFDFPTPVSPINTTSDSDSTCNCAKLWKKEIDGKVKICHQILQQNAKTKHLKTFEQKIIVSFSHFYFLFLSFSLRCKFVGSAIELKFTAENSISDKCAQTDKRKREMLLVKNFCEKSLGFWSTGGKLPNSCLLDKVKDTCSSRFLISPRINLSRLCQYIPSDLNVRKKMPEVTKIPTHHFHFKYFPHTPGESR